MRPDVIDIRAEHDGQGVAFVPWDEFMADIFDWEQGQHISLVGPNGRGKTNLLTHILPLRSYKVFLGTKRKDSTQDALVRGLGDTKYKVAKEWAEVHQDISRNWMLRPPFPKKADVAQLKVYHAHVFREALMSMFREGGWTVAADEVRYLTDYLGLTDVMNLLWLQGRSLKLSVVAGTQRPRNVPLEAYSQASHLFFWQTPDKADVDRVAELASIGRDLVKEVVPNLDAVRHEVLYVNPKTAGMVITIPPEPLT